MNKTAVMLTSILATSLAQPAAIAGPEEDRAAFVRYFQSRFPDVEFDEFANGIYAIDADSRRQWLEIEEFPPYEFAIEQGESEWQQTFANGRTFADCFAQPSDSIRAMYPRYEEARGEVVTLEIALNDCRAANDEEPYAYDAEELIDLTAFLAFEARGKAVAVRIPADQPGAIAAYEDGKRFYYSKRGQLNFACSDCHITSVGQRVRADRLGPSLGHTTHFPVYRSKLGGMIGLQQRFLGCIRDVRAKPFELQSTGYRNLEFFLAYMSNGLMINGPGARK